MKLIVNIFFALLLFSACEEIIDVDLNEANPAIVIEGNLCRSYEEAGVKITRTGSYFSESAVENVSNAKVVIENEKEREFVLLEEENGIYKSYDIDPRYGKTYTLSVEIDGHTYEASSTLNVPVSIDSLSYFFYEGSLLMKGYSLRMYFLDPLDQDNYYRIKVYKNGEYENNADNFLVFKDGFYDGKYLEVTLKHRLFQTGDIARVEFISLDKNAYEYYESLEDLLSTNPGTAAPSNPKSNFSNGALGYFSAWSVSSRTIKIK